MSLNHVKILWFLAKGNKTFFDVPKKEQEEYLLSLGQPKNDIDRSFKQYLCQNYFCAKWKVYLFNFVSHFFYFPVLLGFLILGIRIRKSHYIEAFTIDLKGMEEIIPNLLNEQYKIQMNSWSVKGGLRLKDIPYLLVIYFNHLCSGYFSFKSMIKVAQYSQLITMYSPRCIIAHSEYSFSSSIMTNYCNKRGVQHINVQHGEKLYNIRDSFFRFDECYIWHDHYKKLFLALRAAPLQFKVYKSNSLLINIDQYINRDSFANYKYYLGSFNEDDIKNIVKSMKFVKLKGESVKFRYHPRRTNIALLKKYVTEEDLEDPAKVSIMESIANCNYAVGSYSTVLLQAYFSGKEVLLDDMTYKENFNKLKDLMYILATEDCKKLSDFQLLNKYKGM